MQAEIEAERLQGAFSVGSKCGRTLMNLHGKSLLISDQKDRNHGMLQKYKKNYMILFRACHWQWSVGNKLRFSHKLCMLPHTGRGIHINGEAISGRFAVAVWHCMIFKTSPPKLNPIWRCSDNHFNKTRCFVHAAAYRPRRISNFLWGGGWGNSLFAILSQLWFCQCCVRHWKTA